MGNAMRKVVPPAISAVVPVSVTDFVYGRTVVTTTRDERSVAYKQHIDAAACGALLPTPLRDIIVSYLLRDGTIVAGDRRRPVFVSDARVDGLCCCADAVLYPAITTHERSSRKSGRPEGPHLQMSNGNHTGYTIDLKEPPTLESWRSHMMLGRSPFRTGALRWRVRVDYATPQRTISVGIARPEHFRDPTNFGDRSGRHMWEVRSSHPGLTWHDERSDKEFEDPFSSNRALRTLQTGIIDFQVPSAIVEVAVDLTHNAVYVYIDNGTTTTAKVAASGDAGAGRFGRNEYDGMYQCWANIEKLEECVPCVVLTGQKIGITISTIADD